MQESLRLKRQRPQGGSRGAQGSGGGGEVAGRGQRLGSTEHCCVPHTLVRGAFLNYDSNHVPPFEHTNLSLDGA